MCETHVAGAQPRGACGCRGYWSKQYMNSSLDNQIK
jgi:hypothetical protein